MEKTLNIIKQNLKFKLSILAVTILLIVLDLTTKFYFDDILQTQIIPVINGYFNFALAYNTGVSFSMFNNVEDGQYLLSAFACIVGLALLVYTFVLKDKYDATFYALIAAGALGNGIDRAVNGHVIDFLDFYYKNWHYPTFNLADCFIFIGVFALLTKGLFVKNK